MTKSYLLYSALFLYATVNLAQSEIKPYEKNASKYANTITVADLKKHLIVLTSDSLEGRETGEPGQKKAADYLQNCFIDFGIPPIQAIGNGYFQNFPLSVQYPRGGSIAFGETTYEFKKDFYYYKYTPDTTFNVSEFVFVGYGIDDEIYSDYKKINVKGKVAVMIDGTPNIIQKKGKKDKWTANWRVKLEKAKEQGAAAIIMIDPNFDKNIQKLGHYIESPYVRLLSDTNEQKYLPVVYVSPNLMNDLFRTSGVKKTLEGLVKKINKKEKPQSFDFTQNLSFDIKREEFFLTSENVLGYIEGGDKKDELVILTAHYDHLGKHDGKIYYGADDDGSGTVALLELAQAFMTAKKEGNGPRRSVLIMPVAGEEKGLLGSEYYSENPVFPLSSTVADLNIDMIGRMDDAHKDDPNYIYVIGSDKLSSELHQINENANTNFTHLNLDYKYNDEKDANRFYYRSDHWNFAKNNIPVIFYFNGVHQDYHQPTDSIDKIHFEKMEKITRLVFYTAWELSNRDERIKVDKK